MERLRRMFKYSSLFIWDRWFFDFEYFFLISLFKWLHVKLLLIVQYPEENGMIEKDI